MTEEATGPRDEEGESGRSPRCAACGSRVERTDWHPVATWVDDADEFHLAVFCSEACREEWDED